MDGTIDPMRRFRQWIFNGIAAISLLLCVSTAIAWTRSYWVGDIFGWDGKILAISQFGIQQYWADVWTQKGDVQIVWRHVRDTHYQMGRISDFQFQFGDYGFRHNTGDPLGPPSECLLGFYFSVRTQVDQTVTTHQVLADFPFWSALLIFSIAPIFWLRMGRWTISTPGHCSRCGYDLRATPDRCPECGTIPPKVA